MMMMLLLLGAGTATRDFVQQGKRFSMKKAKRDTARRGPNKQHYSVCYQEV